LLRIEDESSSNNGAKKSSMSVNTAKNKSAMIQGGKTSAIGGNLKSDKKFSILENSKSSSDSRQ
jgi:hypothetical protein